MGNTPKRPKTKTTRPQPTATASANRAVLLRRLGMGAGALAVAAFLVWFAIPQPGAVAGVPEGAIESTPPPTRLHVEGEVAYDQLVPAGGNHNPTWLNCGVYRDPVRAENVLHSFEHGSVWITYQPDLDADSIDRLEGFGFNRRKTIVSPQPGQESPILVTSWGWQMAVASADDGRIVQYVNEFESGPYAPEPGAVCSGGVGNPA